MKSDEARQELTRVLANQQTVSVPKLKRLLEDMNVSLKQDPIYSNEVEEEIRYLKGQIRKLAKKLKGR